MNALNTVIYSPTEQPPLSSPAMTQELPVKAGRWSLYFLCGHCGTEWIDRSETPHTSADCPICSKRCFPFEYGC